VAVKPEFCKGCPINHVTGSQYVPLHSTGGKVLVVAPQPREEDVLQGRPLSDSVGSWFYSAATQAALDRGSLDLINTIGCFTGNPSTHNKPAVAILPGSKLWFLTPRGDAKAALAYCREHHLKPALDRAAAGGQYTKVISLGEEALQATTGKPGITHWRGSAIPLLGHVQEGPKVVATLDPISVMKNANYFSVWAGDLRKGLVLPPEFYNLAPSLDEVRAFTSTKFSFDLEWDEMGDPTICGLTDKYYHCLVVPWTPEYLPELVRIFTAATEVIGHNIVGADLKYIHGLLRKYQSALTARISDTILKQHLVQPDIRHALSVVASILTAKVFWKGKFEYEGEVEDEEESEVKTGVQWKTWNDPVNGTPREFGGYVGCSSANEAFRLYNARDTDGEFQINFPLDLLLKQFDLEGVYRNVSLPAQALCTEMGDTGLRIDHSRIAKVQEEVRGEIEALEATLPPEIRSHQVEVTKMRAAPPGTFAQKSKFCKGSKKLGTLHEKAEIIFLRPQKGWPEKRCPVCNAEIPQPKVFALRKTIKVKEMETVVPWNSAAQMATYASGLGLKTIINRKTDTPTAGKNARKVWGRERSEFTVIDQLKKKITILNSFTKGDQAAATGLFAVRRVLFNLLVFGTSTGRLSCSGREPASLNLQNIPKSVRHIFVPDKPGDVFVEADFSGGENNLTAFLAGDTERLARLRDPSYDEHSDLASRFFETVVSKEINSHLRHPGKIFNHGKTYGMGIRTMWENFMLEGFNYPESKIREFDLAWKELNRGTADWQERTVALTGKQGFLRNAFKRMRWFSSRDYATKSLAFLPSSTLADIALRCMLALHTGRFPQELFELGVKVTGNLPEGWRIVLQIHDSILLCGPEDGAEQAKALLRSVMEQKWEELNGFSLRVEVSESSVSWGEMKTCP
jgi:uracil-DNA glycosylase